MSRVPFATLTLLAGLTGCDSLPGGGPRVIDITSAEYAFGAPDTVPAGLVTFRLSNIGREDHLAAIIPLAEGETITVLMGRGRLLQLRGAMDLLGGPVTSVADRASEATVALAPGRYALFCYLHARDGQSHAAKGMVREIVAAGPAKAVRVEPLPEERIVRVTEFSITSADSFQAGPGRITLVNEGRQPHEVFLTRLADGVSLEAAEAWTDTTPGPSPWESYGGSAAMGPGTRVELIGDFPPGSYWLECYITDLASGESHYDLGMKRRITFFAGS